jgi:DNA helicase-2/ATP-dependent DNA helicase PcrA
MNLTDAQQRAVLATEGPLLIIAGPGSGKTHTLVERVAHLIIDQGVPPEALLVSTFTEKAAAELLTRITNRLDAAGKGREPHRDVPRHDPLHLPAAAR